MILTRVKAGSQYDARPCIALRQHALTLAATHPNARIDSDTIPAFPRVVFTRQIEKFRWYLIGAIREIVTL